MEPLDNNIEEDKLTLFMEWLLANRLQVGVLIGLALVAGMAVYKNKVEVVEKEESSAEDLLAAISPIFQVDGINVDQPVAVLLSKVVQDHPETKAANNAQFLLASALFDEGKFTESAAAFQSYIGLATGGPLAVAAQFGLAASQNAVGEKDKAKKGYEAVISHQGTSHEALQARVALAKLILAQSNPDTVKAKELLLVAAQESQLGRIPGFSGFWGSEAERMLAPLQIQDKADSSKEISGEAKKK